MGTVYQGVGGVRREMASAKVGIDGAVRDVTEIYAGADGVRRLVWQKTPSGGSARAYYEGDDFLDGYTGVVHLTGITVSEVGDYEVYLEWESEQEDILFSVENDGWFYYPDGNFFGKVNSYYDMYTSFIRYNKPD